MGLGELPPRNWAFLQQGLLTSLCTPIMNKYAIIDLQYYGIVSRSITIKMSVFAVLNHEVTKSQVACNQ